MKRILKRSLLLLPLALLMACSDGEPADKPEPGDGSVDLSADEMANCYIVQTPGVYKFKADNQFNLGPGLPVPPEIHPDSAMLVWQSKKGAVTSVELTETPCGNRYIRFEVARASGNALIAALDEDGVIVWSWHIWMPEQEVASVKTATGYEVMNMNLGAMSATPGDPSSYGMLYQWGRKDPFPASETLTGTPSTLSAPVYDIDGNPVLFDHSSWTDASGNTLAAATAHPTVVYSNMAHFSSTRDWLAAGEGNDALWGNPEGTVKEEGLYVNKGQKTCYDPSPAGWMVGPADVFADFTSTGGYAWDFADFNIADTNGDGTVDLADYNYGWHFLTGGTPLYFPAASRFDGSYGMLMGSMSGLWGNYWTNSPSGVGLGFCGLSFQVRDMSGNQVVTVSASGSSSRADAFSIRCVRR